MNILPKKRWHVRTKENIARVRRDEALAAEQAKIEQARINKAESEARLNFLRNESRKKSNTIISTELNTERNDNKPDSSINNQNLSKHINFFEELEQGNIDHTKTNKDYEKDKKEEQEKYEKQIGLLTYLGQGIKEAVNKSWYNELPKRMNDLEKNIEIKPNKKALDDPMQDIKRYLNIISLKSKNKSEVKLDINKIKCDKESINLEDNKTSIKKRKYIQSLQEDSSVDECKAYKKRKNKSSTDNDSSEDNYRSKKKHKKKHKKHKKSKKQKHEKETMNQSTVDIQQMRAERLEREKRERLRAQALLAQVKEVESNSQAKVKQKYNSQFFPELARQNY